MNICFQTSPQKYRHWRLELAGHTASLVLDVKETGGLFDGYELKLNSYDLGVDIELHDAIQRLRFGHPEVKVVIIRSAKDRVYCAGANIRMLARSSHQHKVNFCKFTNETRIAMEDASKHSGMKFIAAINGACAGGGYELALACDHIILADDGSSSVSLPEVPLLAVLPGTGGLTRITDKRHVRRDRADVFCSTEEGIKGTRARDWGLVDDIVALSGFNAHVEKAAARMACDSGRPEDAQGISLAPLSCRREGDALHYSSVSVELDRPHRTAHITIRGPTEAPPDIASLSACGDRYWGIRAARELDDALLHLRFNEPEAGILVFRAIGDVERTMLHDAFVERNANHWLIREILLLWAAVFRRIDLTSRSLVALIEPGTCFAGILFEVALACDRTFMAEGEFEHLPGCESEIRLSAHNFGRFPMSNGQSRLRTRFSGDRLQEDGLQELSGYSLNAEQARENELVTMVYDDIDWEEEVRIFLEERISFSADALTGMEANLRFPGPETMETKIFGRLTAWQNWIFQRPNAAGEESALRRYGTGRKATFDPERI